MSTETPSPVGQADNHNSEEKIQVYTDNSAEGTVHDGGDDSIDAVNEARGAKLLLIHISLCLCTFLVGLDFNLLAVAIPVITTEFGSLDDVGWYGAAFMLAMASTQSLAGKTYILFPKRTVYLVSVFIFEVGSLLSALAPSSAALIIGRAIAGVGASGIFAGGFAILATIVPLHKRSIYLGTINSTFAIASIIGPVLGGAFTEHTTWRWCFYINLPIGGSAAVICAFLIRVQAASTERVPFREKMYSLDGLGFVILVGAITMLLLAFQWGGLEHDWDSATIIGLLVGSAFATSLFVYWQIRQQDRALIPPRLFTAHRNAALLFATAFFINGPFQVVIYWLPIWFQAVLGVSPVRSGVYYLPTVISDVLAAFIGSAIVMQTGYWNPLIIFSEAMVCIGGGLLSTIHPDISSGHWIGYQIFGGVGYSLSTTIVHIGLQASLPKELAPLGSSNALMIISISCAVFLGVGQLAFQNLIQRNLSGVVSSDIIDRVISGGANDLLAIVEEVNNPELLTKYSKSISQIFYITAAAPVLSFFLVSCCKWVSTKPPKPVKDEEEGKVEAKA